MAWLQLIILLTLSPGEVPAPRRVLFVGNSLTYTNDLPSLVKQAAAGKGKDLRVDMLAYPNYAIEDHWNEGRLQRMVASGKYDVVVVQQGPSSQQEGRELLLTYVSRLSVLCKKHEVTLCIFMVWPAVANYFTFEGVIRNYTEAASESGALLCPVGQRWKEHIDATGDYSYYGPDKFHPSLAGSQMAAALIEEVINQWIESHPQDRR